MIAQIQLERDFISTGSKGLSIEAETPRLYIRTYQEEDFEECLKLYSDKISTKYFDHGKPRSPQEIKKYIQGRGRYYFDRGEPYGLFSVFSKDDHTFIGQVDIVPTPGALEIGWIFFSEYHGHGLGSEVVSLFLVKLLDEIIEKGFLAEGEPITKVIATAHPENIASNKLIEKAGLTFEKSAERYGGNPRNWYARTVPQKHIWKADQYHDLSKAQCAAASELLSHLNLHGTEHVLDVGCGDGKITAKIAALVPQGQVLGIDISPQMIAFAKEKFSSDTNLTFSIQDAQTFHYTQIFDLLFSSFALQWIPNKSTFFKKAYKSLKPKGHLALTVPLQTSPELDRATHAILTRPEWAPYFHNFHTNWHFSNKNEIEHLVTENGFHILHLKELTQEILFPSEEAFETYVKLWYTYLNPLPETEKESFFHQVMKKYLTFIPKYPHGEVLMRIPRLDLIAEKRAF